LLKNEGLAVTPADNGKVALDLLAAAGPDQRFDAVLMDLQMPEMDGFEATRAIRDDERFCDLPVIAMTAHAMGGQREKCLAGGMDDYITKPVDPDELHAALDRWIKPGIKRRSLKELAPDDEQLPVSEGFEALPGSLPGFDIEFGLRRVGGNTNLFGKLVHDFCKKYADIVQDLQAALAAGDREQVTRTAHAVKGVAGNLGALELHRAAGELELWSNQAETDASSDCLDIFEKELTQVIKSAGRIKVRAVAGSAGSAETQIDKAQPLMVQLAELLTEGDAAAEKLVARLREYLAAAAFGERLTQLEEQIGLFDFEDALEVLNGIAAELTVSLERKHSQ
jgi:two-component system, sensor histidine kinase and response regulator